MLCIDNSHFFPSSLVIFANIYMKISLPSSADFSTDNSRLPTISSTHSLFSALPHNHILQPAVSSFCPRRSPTFRQALPSRCIVSGQNGKARFCPIRIPNPTYTPNNGQPKTLSNSCTACPYNNKFNLLKGKTCFSTLSVTDKDGNTDSYEPVSTRDINYTDNYQELLTGWISYIQKNYPKYNRYIELIKLLGQEFSLKEASAILHKPQRTLYGWVQTLRPIFKEYMRTIDRI